MPRYWIPESSALAGWDLGGGTLSVFPALANDGSLRSDLR